MHHNSKMNTIKLVWPTIIYKSLLIKKLILLIQIQIQNGQASFYWGVESKWQVQSHQHQTHARNPLDQSLDSTRLSRWSNHFSSPSAFLLFSLLFNLFLLLLQICTLTKTILSVEDIIALIGDKCDGVIGQVLSYIRVFCFSKTSLTISISNFLIFTFQLTEDWGETLFSALSKAGGTAFSNMAVGYNNVDVNAANKYGVAVGNTPVSFFLNSYLNRFIRASSINILRTRLSTHATRFLCKLTTTIKMITNYIITSLGLYV